MYNGWVSIIVSVKHVSRKDAKTAKKTGGGALHLCEKWPEPRSMPKCVFLFVLSVLLAGCGPGVETLTQNGEEYQAYWDEARQRYVHHGDYKAFHENGVQKTAGQYRHGVRIGVWTHWYENGQKQSEMDWVQGQPEGLVIEWHENGQKKNEGHWKNGGRHGLSTWWYPDGTKEKEVIYVDGEPDGAWTYWDSTGAVVRVQHWDGGVLVGEEGKAESGKR